MAIHIIISLKKYIFNYNLNMPNLWTKATQKIAESFNGPRTRDTEFDSKIEEVKSVEKGVINMRQVFQNFLNSTSGFRNTCRELINAIKGVYDNRSPFCSLTKDIVEAHVDLELLYENFFNNVNKLFSRSSEWPVLFTQAKSQVVKREEFRKNYDHYDEKMEKIYKSKQEKLKKGTPETAKDLEFLKRNEDKFKKATEAYVKQSEDTYTTIQTILNKRYDLINPVLSEFIEEEGRFYTKSHLIFKKLESIGSKFKIVAQAAPKSPNTYDACKYIRGGEIIQKDRSPQNIQRVYRDDIANITGKNRSLSTIPTRKQVEEENMKKMSKPPVVIPNMNVNVNPNQNNQNQVIGSNYVFKEFSEFEDQFSRKQSYTINNPVITQQGNKNNNNNTNINMNSFPIQNNNQNFLGNFGAIDINNMNNKNIINNLNPNLYPNMNRNNLNNLPNNNYNINNESSTNSPYNFGNMNNQYSKNSYGMGLNNDFNINYNNYNQNNYTRSSVSMNNYNNFNNNTGISLTPTNNISNRNNNILFENIFSNNNNKDTANEFNYPVMGNNTNTYRIIDNNQQKNNISNVVNAAPDAYKPESNAKLNKGDDFFKDLF